MFRLLKASLVYFALVFGTGFCLGVLRVPFLVPRIGVRWAELAEMPIMAVTIFFCAGYILRRFNEVDRPGKALIVGILALFFAVCAELALAVAFQSQSLAAYIAGRDKISGSVYLVMLAAFALMPRIRLPSRE
jgi:hypothetical protein